ncbi:hypothetical protein FOZ62_012874, partial [Perkinsus olseni]
AKVGLLAPGMSQEIDVVVEPVDYKYKFEWIKVLCGPAAPATSAGPKSWALRVPVHVYATANKLVEGELPSIVDFGRVPIGEKAERRFVLRCDVPLEFDFEVLHLRRHPDIEVTVDRCRITPEDPAELCLEYRPTSYTSAVSEIEVVLAQFGGDPTRRIKVRRMIGSGNRREAAWRVTSHSHSCVVLECLEISLRRWRSDFWVVLARTKAGGVGD